MARRAGAALRVTAEALDAVSPGADEVCAINSSALRGVGFVFNLALLIDSGADEGAGQVGSAVRVSLSPSAVAACFPLPFCCKLRCSCLGSSAVQSAFPFQSYLVEQSCPEGGPCPCHWDSTQPAVPLLLETVPSMFQRLREESPPGEAQLRAPGGDFAERVAGCEPCEMRLRLVVLCWGSLLVVPKLCEVSVCAQPGAGFSLAQRWVLFQLSPTTAPSSVPWVLLHLRGGLELQSGMGLCCGLCHAVPNPVGCSDAGLYLCGL